MGSIRWGDHSTDLSRFITSLYENAEFIDCELDTDGGLVKAHRVILAACSPYFKNLLVEHNKMKIPLKDIKYSDMKHILDFIYYGEVDVPVVDVLSFMKTAQFFQVASFIRFDSNFTDNSSCYDTCRTHLSNSVNFTNGREHSNGVSVREDGISVRTDLQPVSVAVPEETDVTKQLSEVRDVVKTSVKDEEEEDFNDHLPEISFVAVPFSGKLIEEQDDVSSDAEVENSLEEEDSDVPQSRLVERESIQKTAALRIQRSYEAEMNSSAFTFSNPEDCSISNSASVTVGNSILATLLTSDTTKSQPKDTVEGMVNTCHFKDTFAETSADLEVKFETTCDISEHEIEDENLYEDMIPQHAEDLNDAPPTRTEPKEEFVPDDQEERSRINLMGRQQLLIPSEAECGYEENSALTSTLDSSRIGSIPTKKRKKMEATTLRKKSQCDGKMKRDLSSHPGHKSTSEAAAAKCSICEASFTKKASLKRHMQRVHTDPKQFPCNICEETFESKCLVEEHLLTHAGERPFLCEFCGSSFDKESKMRNHVRYHLGCFTCEICKKAFRMRSHLNEHMHTHTGDKPFSCDICQVSYARKYVLKQHMRIHMGDKRFKCEICSESFDRRVTLREHVQKHTGGNVFTCAICQESFACGETLKAHMPMHSNRLKAFACDTSPDPRQVNVKKRMRTNADLKPYACGICKKCFRRNHELEFHMQTHTGKKPFPCEICKMSFLRKAYLQAHKLIHSNKKEFLCTLCKARFNRRDSLDRHSRQTHNIQKLLFTG